jgi:acetyltransferase-like isoleucine patch superfamily enzyme
MGGLDIGDDVMIAPNVSIITTGHPLEPSRRRAYIETKPIVIERNVWIATGATIIGGVTVGENSVVAAGAVVTKDVPPNSLVAGVPAKVIRSLAESPVRNSSDQIEVAGGGGAEVATPQLEHRRNV